MTVQEIADRLGVSVRTVYYIESRALAKLRAALEGPRAPEKPRAVTP